MKSIDLILDEVEELPYENMEVFVDLLNKRFGELKRKRFINESKESLEQYKDGNFKSGSVDDLFDEIAI